MGTGGDGAKAANGEARIERKSCLHGGPCLVLLAELRQSSGKTEMRDGIISVGFETPAQPSDRFGVGVELNFGEADPHHPPGGDGIARRKTECLLDVGFGFRTTAKE